MKITSNLISLVLKLVGVILVFSAILEYIFAVIPSQWQDLNWKITLVNGFVNQGIIPLIGICILFLGWWIADNHSPSSKPSVSLRLFILIITCVFGLFFLLLIPLHIGNVNKVSSDLITQITKKSAQQETQLEGFIAQLQAVSKDPERLKQEIEQRNQVLQAGGVIQGQQLSPQQLQLLSNEKEQLQQLLDLSKEPEKLKTKLEDMKTDLQSKLKEKETEERKKAQNLTLQQSLKTSVMSLILAIAYTVIGWFGLKTMLIKFPSDQ
jgi:hypothetical protein